MLTWLKARFALPIPTEEEKRQKRRILSTLLWLMFGMAMLIGVVNFALDSIPEAAILFATAAAALFAIRLNERGRFVIAGAIATSMFLATIILTLYEAGGLHDAGIVAIPIYVMLGSLLFSRRALPWFLLSALVTVIGIGLFGLSHSTAAGYDKDLADLIVVSLLTIGSGAIVWVTVGSLEHNLQRARRSEARLREAYDRTLEGWSKALEYRDQGTLGHARRVVRLCMRLAEEWSFKQEELSHIYRGALLHDIGKMAVPDRILLKRGPLNPDEWKVVKRHPAVARELLEGIPYLHPALNIPAAHHERWDGTGYPRGLKGSRIPIEARIFTVVDQYDALSSNRPYRRAWPRKKALDYIRENAGRIFDPRVSAAFIRLYQTGAFGADA